MSPEAPAVRLVQFLVRSFDLVKKATIVGTPVRILSNYYDTKKATPVQK